MYQLIARFLLCFCQKHSTIRSCISAVLSDPYGRCQTGKVQHRTGNSGFFFFFPFNGLCRSVTTPIIFRNDAGLASMLTNKWVLLLITLLLGYLMVSRLPMPVLKLKGFAWEDN